MGAGPAPQAGPGVIQERGRGRESQPACLAERCLLVLLGKYYSRKTLKHQGISWTLGLLVLFIANGLPRGVPLPSPLEVLGTWALGALAVHREQVSSLL